MRPVWQHPLPWLLLTFCALAVANSFILPSFESMDEPEHFNYMRYLADGRGLPDQRDVATALAYNYYQEGGQPPLYYLLGSLVLRGLGEDVSDVDSLTVENPFSTCGDLSQPYSKGLWMRDPRREAWPYYGAALGVHAVRILSALLGVVTVAGVHAAGRTTFARIPHVGLVAAALVAFNPRFVVLSGAVTNDTLLAALSAWGLYLVCSILRRGPSLPSSLALGAVAGLAVLTKVSGIFLLPLTVLVFLDRAWRQREWVRCLCHLALIGVLALAIGGWWYLGNLLRYGDPGLVPLVTQDTGQRGEWPTRLILPEIDKFYQSYWASANYCELQLGFFPLYGVLSAVGAVGLVIALWRARGFALRGPLALVIWTGIVFAAWASFNSIVYAPNGRYLFQANAAIGPLLAAGLLTLIGRWPVVWRSLVVGLAVIAFGTPIAVLAPLFNPPVQSAAASISVPHALEATFGESVRLLGYEIGDGRASNVVTVGAGESLDVAVYLAAARPIAESLALGLQLKSLAATDDTVLVNFRSWPGGGNLPTTAWRPGQAFADQYRLQIPDDVAELQLWELRLMFFSYPSVEGTDDRLPVRIEGIPGGPYVVLDRVRVEPRAVEQPPAEATLRPAPAFGASQEVTLTAAEVFGPAQVPEVSVDLWWQVAEPVNGDYTVFVHLIGEDGRLWATGDGLPRAGAMPTSYWQSGDLIVDRHAIELPADLPRGRYDVKVGLYDASRRMPAWDGLGRRLAHDSAIVAHWENGGT